MVGIYKITSPTNKIYIGQSLDVERRFKQYSYLKNCKSQIKLYRSFLKYGVNNHKFEIIEECSIDLLNKRERDWQDFYNVIGKNGLNCLLTSTKEIRKVYSEETKAKISKSLKGKYVGELNSNYGKKKDIEFCKKIAIANSKRIVSDETKLKISNASKNRRHSLETKLKISNANLGNKKSKEEIMKRSEKRNKIIIDLDTGIFYFGAKDLCGSSYLNIKQIYYYLKINKKYKYV